MLSRTADHLYWMARYMERAVRAAQRPAAQPQPGSARKRAAAFSAHTEVNDAV